MTAVATETVLVPVLITGLQQELVLLDWLTTTCTGIGEALA